MGVGVGVGVPLPSGLSTRVRLRIELYQHPHLTIQYFNAQRLVDTTVSAASPEHLGVHWRRVVGEMYSLSENVQKARTNVYHSLSCFQQVRFQPVTGPITVPATVSMVKVTTFITLSAIVVILSISAHGDDYLDNVFKDTDKEYFNGKFWTGKRQSVPGDLRYYAAFDLCEKLGYDKLKSLSACAGTSLLSGCVPYSGKRDGKVPTVFLSPCPKGHTCRSLPYGWNRGQCMHIGGTPYDEFEDRNTRWYGGKFWEEERKHTTGGKEYLDASSLCQAEGYDSYQYLGGCAGTDLLAGCRTTEGTKPAVVFTSACPTGYSCRYQTSHHKDRGKCTQNAN